MQRIVFGIDLGSRLSGNTVVAIFNHGKIHFMQVDKNVDADLFVLNAAKHFHPEHIFLDAPLSLPGRYCGLTGFTDYHFRKCDRELKAMSPMFLGGLTARAMELRDNLEAEGIPVFETYPREMARKQGLDQFGYKSGKSALLHCRSMLRKHLNPQIEMDCQDLVSWHHVDALLALMSALAFVCNAHKVFGDASEGCIYV